MSIHLRFRFLILILLGAIPALLHAAPAADLWEIWDDSNEANEAQIDHRAWNDILEVYVHVGEDGINRYAYGEMSGEDRAKLQDYLTRMQDIDPRDYRQEEQLVYWINLYNSLTVELVVENYPVKSITKISNWFFSFGPWNDAIAEVAGESVTLNDIEHRILRPVWEDFRLHFALNCASLGCPNLQNRAFTADNAEDLLEKSAYEYLSHSRGMRFDGDRLYLSSIFDWYAVDFGSDLQEVLETLSEYAPEEVADKLENHSGKVEFDYDWGLNDSSGQ